MPPRSLAPPATLALFLATVTTYLVQVLVGGDLVERNLGLIPANVSRLTTFPATGGGQRVPAWLTLVTYMFPHGGWWHVSLNMAGLWFFGRLAEPIMGTGRFLLVYLTSGVVAGLAIVILGPHWTRSAVGASGAISGVLGSFLALRLPRQAAWGRRNLVALAVESAFFLVIAAWLGVRTPPRVPDCMSALMWHLIPFLAGWVWVRVGRQVAQEEPG